MEVPGRALQPAPTNFLFLQWPSGGVFAVAPITAQGQPKRQFPGRSSSSNRQEAPSSTGLGVPLPASTRALPFLFHLHPPAFPPHLFSSRRHSPTVAPWGKEFEKEQQQQLHTSKQSAGWPGILIVSTVVTPTRSSNCSSPPPPCPPRHSFPVAALPTTSVLPYCSSPSSRA